MNFSLIHRFTSPGSPQPASVSLVRPPGFKRQLAGQQPVAWLAAAVMLCLLLVVRAHAGTNSINWSSIDGGAGSSTGGVFMVTGTVGQPDAHGFMAGGSYSVAGGYWALPVTVAAVGVPTVNIVRAAPGLAIISWPTNTTGFVLQEATSLTPANWTNSLSGATNPIVVPATPPLRFYRLRAL